MKKAGISSSFTVIAFVVMLVSVFPSAAMASDPFIKAGGESDPRLMLSLRTSFLYSTFSPAIGFGVRFSGYTPVWNTERATGTVDVGLMVNYANGSKFMYPWVQDTATQKMDGADHYTMVALSFGHSFYFGQSRTHQFGVHMFFGVNVQTSVWRLEYVDEGLSGKETMSFTGITFGPELEYTYRFHRYIGFHAVIGGAFGSGSVGPAGPMLRVGAGLTFYVR